jgi:hypothetical protein
MSSLDPALNLIVQQHSNFLLAVRRTLIGVRDQRRASSLFSFEIRIQWGCKGSIQWRYECRLTFFILRSALNPAHLKPRKRIQGYLAKAFITTSYVSSTEALACSIRRHYPPYLVL